MTFSLDGKVLVSSPKGKKIRPVAHRDRNVVPIVAKCHGTRGVLAKLSRPVEGRPPCQQFDREIRRFSRISGSIRSPQLTHRQPDRPSHVPVVSSEPSRLIGTMNPRQRGQVPLRFSIRLKRRPLPRSGTVISYDFSVGDSFPARIDMARSTHRTEHGRFPLLGNVLKCVRDFPGVFQGWEVLSPPSEGRKSHQRRCRCPPTRD